MFLLPLGLSWVVTGREGTWRHFLQCSRSLSAWCRELRKKMNKVLFVQQRSSWDSEGSGFLTTQWPFKTQEEFISPILLYSWCSAPHSDLFQRKVPVTSSFPHSLDGLQKGTSKWWHGWGWIPAAHPPDTSVPDCWPLPHLPTLFPS